MKREHTQKAMILLILYCIIASPHFAFGQNGNQSPSQLKENGSHLLFTNFIKINKYEKQISHS
jgi:hypothetical protein